jgi:alpha-glucosidase
MRLKPINDLDILFSIDTNTVAGTQPRASYTIQALEHDVVRVQLLPDGVSRLNRTWMVVDHEGYMPKEGRSRDDLWRFTRPDVEYSEKDTHIAIRTEALKLQVARGTGAITWMTLEGVSFASDVPSRAYVNDLSGDTVQHYMRLHDDACFYGFGERAGPINKRGMRMEMRNLDAPGYSARDSDPLYKHFPVYITYLPELDLAYGLLYDNVSTTVFDMGREIDAIWGLYTKYEAQAGDIDYYMLFGPTIPDVVEKITWLTGKPFLPPRYTLGYLGSTMKYTEADNAQDELKQFVDLVRAHDIPCDGFHLSSGYTTDSDGNRNVFTWNNARIPKPTAMVEGFHTAHINVMANVKPYLLEVNPHYAGRTMEGGLLRDVDTDSHYTTLFWSGGAFESATGAYIDFSSEAGYTWWQSQLKAQLFDYGIGVIWNDNNEIEVWDGEVICDGFGSSFPIKVGRSIQTLLMCHASYYATVANAPSQRPFAISRSGMPGIQRYAQTWSGDNDTSWEDLQYNIPMGLGLSLSGAPNTGHDVGGFFGPAPDPELFLRWVQNGVMHPRFTIHSWNTDGTVNEPWMYPAVLPQIRQAIDFRYRLLPFLYSLFWQAHQDGTPIIRPTVYRFWRDPNTHDQSFDFLLGDGLLVASVYEPGVRVREVYLPHGVKWCDFHTGRWYDGGQTVHIDAPLDRIPLLACEGTIIPTGKRMRYVDELPDDERTVYLFPHRNEGEGVFRLIEDDGQTVAYQQGGFATVLIRLWSDEAQLYLNLEIDDEGYILPYRDMQFILPPGEARPISVKSNQQIAVSEFGTIDRRVIEVHLS